MKPYMSMVIQPNWCAGAQLRGLHNHTLEFTLDDILALWKNNTATKLRSIIFVTVNADEINLINKLRRMGFKSGVKMMNYGHKSRKTWMMYYQVPVELWEQVTGFKRDRNWS